MLKPPVLSDLTGAPDDFWVALRDAICELQDLAVRPTLRKGREKSQRWILSKLSNSKSHKRRRYSKQAVVNVNLVSDYIRREVESGGARPISAEVIASYNCALLAGVPFAPRATPGQLRQYNVIVHLYRPQKWDTCLRSLHEMCAWLNADTHFSPALDAIVAGIIKAIAAHLMLVLIHPFGDGNGRTARLLEYRLLLEAGVPASVAHLLNNHYNWNRAAYYSALEEVTLGGAAIDFLTFAIEGLAIQLSKQNALITPGSREQRRVTPLNSTAASTPSAHAPLGAA